jgi:uncharacterized protein YidB (DUF937 family)
MATPVTSFHIKRLTNQIETNLHNLQVAMRTNAQFWKDHALATTATPEKLSEMMVDAAGRYLGNLQWILDALNHEGHGEAVCAMFTAQGFSETECEDLVNHLKQDALKLMDLAAHKTSYAEIISACDQVLADVDAVPSIWPE